MTTRTQSARNTLDENRQIANEESAEPENALGFDLEAEEETIADREERGCIVHIKNERGQKMYDGGEPVTMSVKGTYSHTYRRLSTGQRDELIRTRRSSVTGEMLDQKDLNLVAGCVFDWKGFKKSGTPIPLSKKAVIAVFEKWPFIYDQIREEMGARENFFAKSSPSSPTP
jgi:hypothetical protein